MPAATESESPKGPTTSAALGTGRGQGQPPRGNKVRKTFRGSRGHPPTGPRRSQRTKSCSEDQASSSRWPQGQSSGGDYSNTRERTVSAGEELSNWRTRTTSESEEPSKRRKKPMRGGEEHWNRRRTTSDGAEHMNWREGGTSADEEQSGTGTRRRTISVQGEQMNTTRRQRTTSFNSEQGRYNRKHRTSIGEEHENKGNAKQRDSKNNNEQVSLKSTREHVSQNNNSEQDREEHITAANKEKQTHNKTKKKLTTSRGNEERIVPTKNTEEHICSSSSVKQRCDEQLTSRTQEQVPSNICEQTVTSLSSVKQITTHSGREQITAHSGREQITAHSGREQIDSHVDVKQTKPKNSEEHTKVKRNKQTKQKHINEHTRITDAKEQTKPNNTEKQIQSKTNEQLKSQSAEKTKLKNTEEISKPKQSEEQVKTKSEDQTKKSEEQAKTRSEEQAKIKSEEQAKIKSEEQAKVKSEQQTITQSEEQAKTKSVEQAKTKSDEQTKLMIAQEQTKPLNTEEQTRPKTKLTNPKHTEEQAISKTEEQSKPKRAEKQTKHKTKEKTKTKNAEEQTKLAFVEQTKLASVEQTKLASVEQTKLASVEQTKLASVEQTKLASVEQTKLASVEQTKLASVEQTKSTNAEEERNSKKIADQTKHKTEEQIKFKKTEEQTTLNTEEQTKLMSVEKQTEIKNTEEQTKPSNEEKIQIKNTEQTKLKEVELVPQASDEQMPSQDLEKHSSNQKSGEHGCSPCTEELKSKEDHDVEEQAISQSVEEHKSEEKQNAEEQTCSEGTGNCKSLKEHDVEEHETSHVTGEHKSMVEQSVEHPSSQDEEHKSMMEQSVEEHPSSQDEEEHKSREEHIVKEHPSSQGEAEHKRKEEHNVEEHPSSQCIGELKCITEQSVEEHPSSQGTEEHKGKEEPCSQRSVRPRDKRVTFRQSESAAPPNVNKSAGTPREDATQSDPLDRCNVPSRTSGAVAGEEGAAAEGTDAPGLKQWKVPDKQKQGKREESEQGNCHHRQLKDESGAFLPNLQRPSFRMEEGGEQQEPEIGMCANCGFLAKLRCANCRQAFYCKRECQREHWKNGHKDQCQPFQVLESAALGRCMVASRDLKAGDVILREEPIAVGPKQITEPVCLSCYKRVDGSYRCQKCNWPLCGPACEASPDHLPECVVGQEIGSPIDIANFDQPNHFYEVIFPLRCLALKKKSPKKYEQLLSLESHYEDRKGTHLHQENQKSIVNFLRNYFFIQEFPIEDIDSSEKSIHTITGIIDVNSLEIRLKESEVLGLYPTFAMLEHSCTPNTKHAFGKDRQVIVKAAVDIKRGEHISTMYTHILWGTAARRDHLKHSKYFMCTCFRCSDPTELGTHFSALRCKQCSNGFILSAAPLDELATWICTSCNATMAADEVTAINLKLGEEIEGALAMPVLETLEKLVQRHAKTTVHPNHFHLFAARHTVLQMYGRDPSSVGQESMKKKEKMCQEFLKVCTALDPGMARLAPYAGVALYEYHLAVLARARLEPDAKHVDSVALKKDVETAKALLQQCIRVLQDEPKDQPEGQLCHVAQQNLAELRQWEATLNSP